MIGYKFEGAALASHRVMEKNLGSLLSLRLILHYLGYCEVIIYGTFSFLLFLAQTPEL